MGRRLRNAVAAAAVVALLTPAVPAEAEVFSACWVVRVEDPFLGLDRTITRCRIAGGEIVNYASDDVVPSVLYPQPGTDATGACWYYTSAVTQYVIVLQYPNGDAEIGWDPDPSTPGGIIAIGVTYPRCSSEPRAAPDPTAEVWQYVHSYVHPPPTPRLSPAAGDGLTGLDTYVGVPIPTDHFATISGGGATVDVFIEVSAVVVAWGDGTTGTYPATVAAMAGYPAGIASHVYETKSEEGVTISVSYDWTARWRFSGGAWAFIGVPNTTTSVLYPIQEIVSTLSD